MLFCSESTGGSCIFLLAAPWAKPVALLADGALLYTSINSLGRSFAKKERMPYAVPMLIGVVGGFFAVFGLLVF